jgi:hypothetical protein
MSADYAPTCEREGRVRMQNLFLRFNPAEGLVEAPADNLSEAPFRSQHEFFVAKNRA